MTIETFYKRIPLLYGFLILFATQHYYFFRINYKLSFYEYVVGFVFGLSVITVLSSLIILSVQTTSTVNKEKIVPTNIAILILNLVLYYAVISSSIYLGSQMR